MKNSRLSASFRGIAVLLFGARAQVTQEFHIGQKLVNRRQHIQS
jgi:hypothetical protein